MNILTDEEICVIHDDDTVQTRFELARAVEKAVLQKLTAGVSVEPVDGALLDDMVEGSHPSYGRGLFATDNCIQPLYTADTIAAARVQENERCANVAESFGFTVCALAIRALIGGQQ